MGPRVMATAEMLLTNHMVHVIGSDAHSIRSRNTNLTSAVDKITRLIGAEQARQLLFVNADNIIHSREVDIPEIEGIQYPRGKNGILHWFAKLWK